MTKYLSCLAAIEELPLTNSPEVFGLHANAEIGYYTQAVKDMWNILIELQPQTCKYIIIILNDHDL